MSSEPQELTALVLAVHDYSESSQIIHALTPLGRIHVLAKGIKRPRSSLGGPVDHCQVLQLQLFMKKRHDALHTLVGLKRIAWFAGLRRSLLKFHAAEVVREVLRRTPIPASEAPSLLNLALQALGHLESDDNALPAITRFLARFLALFGLTPELNHCVLTGKPLTSAATQPFSFFYSGLISPAKAADRSTVALTPRVIELLRALFSPEKVEQGFRRDAWQEAYKVCMKLCGQALGDPVLAGRAMWKEYRARVLAA